jgi:ABC-2 type transport system permease protein
MAVHRRVYQPLGAGLTPPWSRFLVLARYAREAMGSRFLTGFIVLCFVPPLLAAGWIYLFNNPMAQSLLGMKGEITGFLQIDGKFFYRLLCCQGALAFLLTAWVGPGLVAPDLTNGALPLYLCRPFSRAEYVLGRFTTLFVLLSIITWAPGLLLYAFQSALGADGWWSGHLFVPWAMLVGSLIWIALLALLALALSAYVRWRIVATGLFAAAFFVSAGIGGTLNQVLRTYWGNVFNLGYVITTVWRDLFRVPGGQRTRRGDVGLSRLSDVPPGYCWLMLLAVTLLCLYVLNRRLRAREVVRG